MVMTAVPAASRSSSTPPTGPGANSATSTTTSPTRNTAVGLSRFMPPPRILRRDFAQVRCPCDQEYEVAPVLVVNRFVVRDETAFVPRATAALAALSGRPGFVSGSFG